MFPFVPGRSTLQRACVASPAMRLATFDVYPKTLSEFRQRTLTGAAVSIACTLLIAVLTVIEVADYLQVKQDDHLFVDTSRGQQLRINLNVTFPALPCSVLSLDTLDVSGNHAANIMQNIHKVRLDALQHGQSVDSRSQLGAHAATTHCSRGLSACPCPTYGPEGRALAAWVRRQLAALGRRFPPPLAMQADGRRMPEDEPIAKAAQKVAEAAQKVAEAAQAHGQPTARRLLAVHHEDDEEDVEDDEEEDDRRGRGHDRRGRGRAAAAPARRASGIGELRAGQGADLRPAGGLGGGRATGLKELLGGPEPQPQPQP